MRLNLFIAKTGVASRRGADLLIKSGKVIVNGKKTQEPYLQVDKCDNVKVNGKAVTINEYVYFIFNKPCGVITTLRDRFADKKVIDFFPKEFKRIYPVGRLDKNSQGLIILTNDGDFCYRVTHPKFNLEKEIQAKIH